MGGAKYREILNENFLASARTLKMVHRWVFQYGIDPKHMTQEEEERPRPSPDLNPLEKWS